MEFVPLAPPNVAERRQKSSGSLFLGLVLAIIVATLTLAVLITWIFSGFQARGGYTSVAVGEPFSFGPATVSFEWATAVTSSPRQIPDNEKEWKIQVEGTCQVTDEEHMRHTSLSMLMSKAVHAGEMQGEDLYVSKTGMASIRESNAQMPRKDLAPGLDPMPCQMTFDMPDGYAPGEDILVLTSIQEWGEAPGVQSSNNAVEQWTNSGTFMRVALPLAIAD